MGACDFITRAKGENADKAFGRARDNAAWEHGHGGYTGTIAEKHGFREVEVPAGVDPIAHVHELMDYDQHESGFWWDKWGDAGCVKIAEGEWMFFGVASS